jgi:hypothetical protein
MITRGRIPLLYVLCRRFRKSPALIMDVSGRTSDISQILHRTGFLGRFFIGNKSTCSLSRQDLCNLRFCLTLHSPLFPSDWFRFLDVSHVVENVEGSVCSEGGGDFPVHPPGIRCPHINLTLLTHCTRTYVCKLHTISFLVS